MQNDIYVIVNTDRGVGQVAALYNQEGNFFFNGVMITDNVKSISIPIRENGKIKFYDLNKSAFKKYLLLSGMRNLI